MTDVVKVVVSAARGPASTVPGPAGLSPFTNLTDLGGKSDGTDSSAAIATAVSTKAAFVVLPAQSTQKRTWYFGTDFPIVDLAAARVTLDVDPEAVVSIPSASLMSPFRLRHARSTWYRFRDINADYQARPNTNLPRVEKSIFLDDGMPDWTRYSSVSPSTLAARKVSWNTANAWADDAFSGGTSASSFGHAFSADGDGAFHIGFRRVRPGQRFSARPGVAGGSPLLAAIVRHTGGYDGVAGETNSAPAVNVIEKPLASAGSFTDAKFFAKDTHASYWPANAIWTIQIDSWNTYSVFLNGLQATRRKVDGFIFEAGFGMFPLGSGTSVSWNDLHLVEGYKPSAPQLTSILFCGDSRMMVRDACPADIARDALDLACGVRCYRFDNQAVSGQDTSAQRTILAGKDLTKYNKVVIPLGTNNVQGDGSVAAMMTDIDAMCQQARAAKCDPILVVFPLWYTQGQAGAGKGVLSEDYEKGAPYRSAQLRYAADKGYQVLDLSWLTGPVIAHYVNANLGLDLTGLGDPVVFDNIHFTAIFNEVYGRALAKLLLGGFTSRPMLTLGEQALTPQNGWGATLTQPTLQISSSGMVTLGGEFTDAGGSSPAARADGTVITTLPPYAWPAKDFRCRPVAQNFAESPLIVVSRLTGEVRIYNLPTSTWIDLSDVQFPLAG